MKPVRILGLLLRFSALYDQTQIFKDTGVKKFYDGNHINQMEGGREGDEGQIISELS